MFLPDPSNELFAAAVRLVNEGNHPLFLTGKAGTGKTTFLKYIREHCPKRMAVLAPTGVAAINAGGVTLHSFFQLPLAPFIPDTAGTGFSDGEKTSNKHSLLSQLRFNREKKKLIQRIELLIIDEISMVRCDVLDAVDTILRHMRNRPAEAFGGVQLLFIGDLFQLPPVTREEEWKLLSDYYPGPYFFDSLVLRNNPLLCITFTKIYRQKDPLFVDLLNQVRNNQLDTSGTAILEQRYQPGFQPGKSGGYIILTTHNARAAAINNQELAQLTGRSFEYKATIADDFPDRAWPADELLTLKPGAQVMFIRNDSAENGKRFFNGRLGTILELEKDKIIVRCNSEEGYDDITVEKETWENIRYSVDKGSRTLREEVLGSFTQYPLRLAWAITIHKSQGLTFDKAIIDAGEAFAPGQVYVALSRCTSLDGMILRSRINATGIANDPRIVAFSQLALSENQLQQAMEASANSYCMAVFRDLAGFQPVYSFLAELKQLLRMQVTAFNPEAGTWYTQLEEKTAPLQDVGEKFLRWLQNYFAEKQASDQVLQEKIKAAAAYFEKEIAALLAFLTDCPVRTDSKTYSREFQDITLEIFSLLAEKKYLFSGLQEGFHATAFSQHRTVFRLPAFPVQVYAGHIAAKTESPHPDLLRKLRQLRDKICLPKDLPLYLVAGSETLAEMARYLPRTARELEQIKGMGVAKIEKYGQQFLDIINNYCEENGLASVIHEKEDSRPSRKKKTTQPKEKAAKKESSHSETFRLFSEGSSIESIAAQRGLQPATIANHLLPYVQSRQVELDAVLDPAKQKAIQAALSHWDGKTINSVKQQVDSSVSYSDIRFFFAAKESVPDQQS